MPDAYAIRRAEKLIRDIVSTLELDLTGLTILTEAGSNHFIYTPLIAYYAGAAKVFVWIRDTGYGQADDIEKELYTVISQLTLDQHRFEVACNERPVTHIQQAKIITNLGFVRPIDAGFVSQLSSDAVVSYMCEAWEVRESDVDIEACKQRGVPVAGVWENHPDLMIFSGCGALSVKLCLEAGLEVYQNRILILSSDKFGQTAADAFSRMGAAEVKVTAPYSIADTDLENWDIVFVADYTYGDEILGRNIEHRTAELQQVAVVHLCGCVDYSFLNAEGVFCYPQQSGATKRMTRTLAHLGPKPVIDLHAAGMKVGERLYKKLPSPLVQVL